MEILEEKKRRNIWNSNSKWKHSYTNYRHQITDSEILEDSWVFLKNHNQTRENQRQKEVLKRNHKIKNFTYTGIGEELHWISLKNLCKQEFNGVKYLKCWRTPPSQPRFLYCDLIFKSKEEVVSQTSKNWKNSLPKRLSWQETFLQREEKMT